MTPQVGMTPMDPGPCATRIDNHASGEYQRGGAARSEPRLGAAAQKVLCIERLLGEVCREAEERAEVASRSLRLKYGGEVERDANHADRCYCTPRREAVQFVEHRERKSARIHPSARSGTRDRATKKGRRETHLNMLSKLPNANAVLRLSAIAVGAVQCSTSSLS